MVAMIARLTRCARRHHSSLLSRAQLERSEECWRGARSAAARVMHVARGLPTRLTPPRACNVCVSGEAERTSDAWQRVGSCCASSLQLRCVKCGLAASDGHCNPCAAWGSSRSHDGRCKPLSCGSTRRQRTPSSSSPWRPASTRCAPASMPIGHKGPHGMGAAEVPDTTASGGKILA